MKSILITGGSGRVGSIIISDLEKNYSIDNYDLANGDDIFDEKKLKERVKGKYAVIHLAAIPHPEKGPEFLYRKINYEGSINVFEIAKETRVKKFIFASSGCVYGMWNGMVQPDKFPLTEDNYKPTIEEGQTYYGYYKLKFEEYLEKNSSENIKSVALRLEIPRFDPSASHLFAKASPINVIQIVNLILEKELEHNFDAFNVGDGIVPRYIKVQKEIKKNWPNVSNLTKGNEPLYSIEKAKRLLGYNPIDVYDSKYYLKYIIRSMKEFAIKHYKILAPGVFLSGILVGYLLCLLIMALL